MKPLLISLFTLTFISFFTHCKKNNTPQQPVDKIDTIAPGYYIIRTKYMCEAGKAFVLGSFSNYELLDWQPVTPEELKAIKEDGPPASNNYIWKVGASTGSGVATQLPGPYSVVGAIRVFSISQKAPDESNRYLPIPAGADSHEDNTGLGIGPSYRVTQSAFSDADLPNVNTALTYLPVTDSTGRLAGFGRPYWWYLSLPTDPDDVCDDDYNSMVIWRNSWVCPNSTSTGNVWKMQACAISELVLEKVD